MKIYVRYHIDTSIDVLTLVFKENVARKIYNLLQYLNSAEFGKIFDNFHSPTKTEIYLRM